MLRNWVLLFTLGSTLLLRGVSCSPLPPSEILQQRSGTENEDCSPCGQRRHLATSFGLTGITGAVNNNGVYIGLFPNDNETLCDLEKKVNAPFVFHGRYAQLTRGQNWDASQIWSIAEDLRKTKAILQISLMPESTWWGLTSDNNCQAQAIADQISKIQGQTSSKVWLRFAPDMNYYQTSAGGNQYGTDKNAFMTAWALVYKAVQEKAPDTKMIWSPTYTSTTSVFDDYWPKHATPHVVGMAYSPSSTPDKGDFAKQVQAFHDKYSGPERPFILSQTSPSADKVSEKDRIDFLNSITSSDAVDSLPHYIGLTYYNYPGAKADKRIIILDKERTNGTDVAKMNRLTTAWIKE